MRTAQIQYQEESKINPKKFVVWLFVIAIIMFFAGLTSAYIVRKGEGNWSDFNMPVHFIYSTIAIILSSIALWWAKHNTKNDNTKQIKIGLLFTLILGISFCIFQFYAWKNLVSQNLYFADNTNGDNISASFIYALTGLHVLHVLAGLVFLLIVFYKSLLNKISSNRIMVIEQLGIYWHFIGIVWIYLYLFFNLT